MLAACLACTTPLPARAQQPDLTGLDDGMVGPRTRMLVLGSVHLREQKDFRAEALAPLLDKLAAFGPEVITIEAIAAAHQVKTSFTPKACNNSAPAGPEGAKHQSKRYPVTTGGNTSGRLTTVSIIHLADKGARASA